MHTGQPTPTLHTPRLGLAALFSVAIGYALMLFKPDGLPG
jgi:hypothetical protein